MLDSILAAKETPVSINESVGEMKSLCILRAPATWQIARRVFFSPRICNKSQSAINYSFSSCFKFYEMDVL